MLCPTPELEAMLSALPAWLLYPSYRSLITLVYSAVSILFVYVYIGIAKMFQLLFKKNKKD